jgi:arabinofuranosyltransferase
VPAAGLLAFVGWTFWLHGEPGVGVDDANIFFSYAENLVAGKGLVYGANSERVEGFTSILWMLVCALVFWLGGQEGALLGVSVGLLAGTQGILLGILRRADGGRGGAWPWGALYVVLILASPAYITWNSITLMDTALWGFAVAGMTRAALYPPRGPAGWVGAATVFLVAPLARPEGMVVAPAFIGLLWLRSRNRGARGSSSAALLLLAGVAAVIGATTAFRLGYFGFPLPNTYYAKVAPSLAYNLGQGARYAWRFLVASPLVLVALLTMGWATRGIVPGLGAALRGKEGGIRAHHALAMGVLVLLALPVLLGGDHFGMFRFYQPAYPLICLLPALCGISWSREGGSLAFLGPGGRRWRIALMLGAPLVVAGLFSAAFKESWARLASGSPSSLAVEFQLADEGLRKGAELSELFAQAPRLPVLGVITAGGIARSYPGPLIDLMGLNDTRIAHSAGDRRGVKNHSAFEKEVFLSLPTDVLLVRLDDWTKGVLKGLLADPRFTARWSFGTLSRTGGPRTGSALFLSRDFLEELRGTPALTFEESRRWNGEEWHPVPTPGTAMDRAESAQ